MIKVEFIKNYIVTVGVGKVPIEKTIEKGVIMDMEKMHAENLIRVQVVKKV